MRALRTILVVGVVASLLLFAQAAFAEEDITGIPCGKYPGSAVGSNPGSVPFAVTIYVSPGRAGNAKLTAVTSMLPIPVSVEGVPARVPHGWDIPVTANFASIQLFGDGVARLRLRDGQWTLYGSGTGSFRGKSGSGRGTASKVEGSWSTGAQVLDAFQGFVGGGEEVAAAAPAEYIESEWAPEAAAPADAGSADFEPTTSPPSVTGQALAFFFVMILFFLFMFL